MRLTLALLLALFGGVGSVSADVVTNVTCAVGTNPAILNSSDCSINANSQPSSRASVTVNQLATIPAEGLSTPLTVSLSGSASAIGLSHIETGPDTSAGASANATATYELSTLGPVRQGILTYLGTFSNWVYGAGYDSAQISASLGSLSGSCGGAQPLCSGLFGSVAPRSVPFTLGNNFSFQLADAFTALGDPHIPGPGSVGGTANFTFQLFEADGTTPVTLYAAPEPGTLGLLLLSFLGLGIVAVRTRRVRAGQAS